VNDWHKTGLVTLFTPMGNEVLLENYFSYMYYMAINKEYVVPHIW